MSICPDLRPLRDRFKLFIVRRLSGVGITKEVQQGRKHVGVVVIDGNIVVPRYEPVTDCLVKDRCFHHRAAVSARMASKG